MPQLLRVQNFSISSDGIAAGKDQSLDSPFGFDPGDLMAWAGATASWPNRTDPGGSRGLDDYFTRDFTHNIGAEIMGRNKFGPQRGPWQDHAWQGWWGEDVRLGGGVTTIRQFLDADLVDTMHVAVAPVEFGAGLELWESPEELTDRFHLEKVPSPSGVTHHLFWRK